MLVRKIIRNIVNRRPSINNYSSSYLLYNNVTGMSKDRRKFLIVNVFDCVLITLLWLLSTVTKAGGGGLPSIFMEEINIADPHFLYKSLFDLEILGFLRMTVLLFFYAWVKCDHWLPVAFTTSVTTIFIAIKILFFFNKSGVSMPQYLVIISSLLIAWFELWLMPFRVLHRENQRRDQSVETSCATSVSPATHSRNILASNLITPEIIIHDEDFQTALEYSSDEGGPDKFMDVSGIGRIGRRSCKETIARAQAEAEIMIKSVRNWKILRAGLPEIRLHEATNSYYLRKEFAYPVKSVFDAVWFENSKWNTQVLDVRTLAKIDPLTELFLSVSAPACSGYISSRHFLDVRRFSHNQRMNVYTGVFTSIEAIRTHSSESNTSKGSEIRGKNGVNFIRISPLSGSNQSLFEFIMNTDPRGSIPKMLIRRTFCSFLIDYAKALDNFLIKKSVETNS